MNLGGHQIRCSYAAIAAAPASRGRSDGVKGGGISSSLPPVKLGVLYFCLAWRLVELGGKGDGRTGERLNSLSGGHFSP